MIAIEYASWPVAQPGTQTRICSLGGVRSTSSGMMRCSSALKAPSSYLIEEEGVEFFVHSPFASLQDDGTFKRVEDGPRLLCHDVFIEGEMVEYLSGVACIGAGHDGECMGADPACWETTPP